MTQSRGEVRVVLRRRFDSVLGWTMCAGALLYLAYGLLNPFPGSGHADQLEVLGISFVLLWVAWLVTAHPVVKVYESGVLVVNWFVRYWVPWSALDEVQVTDELVLLTRSGDRIRPATGAFSVASSVMKNSLQNRLRDAIVQARPSEVSSEVASVQKSLDLGLVQLLVVLVPFLVIAWVGVPHS